jgi:hypothetical protein
MPWQEQWKLSKKLPPLSTPPPSRNGQPQGKNKKEFKKSHNFDENFHEIKVIKHSREPCCNQQGPML